MDYRWDVRREKRVWGLGEGATLSFFFFFSKAFRLLRAHSRSTRRHPLATFIATFVLTFTPTTITSTTAPSRSFAFMASPISSSGSGIPGRKRVEPSKTRKLKQQWFLPCPWHPNSMRRLLGRPERPSPATPVPSGDSVPDIHDQVTKSSHPLESEEAHIHHSTDIARLEPSTTLQAQSTGSIPSIVAPSSSASPQSPVFDQAINNSMQKSHVFINDNSIDTTMVSSSVFVSSRTASVSGTNGSTSRSSSQSIITTISAPYAIQASASPPQINLPLAPSPTKRTHRRIHLPHNHESPQRIRRPTPAMSKSRQASCGRCFDV